MASKEMDPVFISTSTGTNSKRVDWMKYKMHDTLQGHIHLAKHPNDNSLWYLPPNQRPIIIKETKKELIHSKRTMQNQKCKENYYEEVRILKYISSLKDGSAGSNGICHIIDDYIWNNTTNEYYAMEYCEIGLFDFIHNSFEEKKGIMQQIMNNNNNNINRTVPYKPWIDKIQNIFQQIVLTVSYLHSNGIAHRDLSLENTMIYDYQTETVKIIDFGLAHDIHVNNGSWFSNQRVGKSNYLAPEVYKKKLYDSRSADIWCLGIMLFMMLIGAPPYQRQSTDFKKVFSLLINNHIKELLICWNRLWMVNDNVLDLLNKIFKYENERIKMDELLCHPFVGLEDHYNKQQQNEQDKQLKELFGGVKTTLSDINNNTDHTTSNIAYNSNNHQYDDDNKDNNDNMPAQQIQQQLQFNDIDCNECNMNDDYNEFDINGSTSTHQFNDIYNNLCDDEPIFDPTNDDDFYDTSSIVTYDVNNDGSMQYYQPQSHNNPNQQAQQQFNNNNLYNQNQTNYFDPSSSTMDYYYSNNMVNGNLINNLDDDDDHHPDHSNMDIDIDIDKWVDNIEKNNNNKQHGQQISSNSFYQTTCYIQHSPMSYIDNIDNYDAYLSNKKQDYHNGRVVSPNAHNNNNNNVYNKQSSNIYKNDEPSFISNKNDESSFNKNDFDVTPTSGINLIKYVKQKKEQQRENKQYHNNWHYIS